MAERSSTARPETDATDRRYMRLALHEARRGEGRTSPNPLVGAVVVKDGRVLTTGYHHAAGRAHAEIEALNAAGSASQDAVVYVNLEPCCHEGRRHACTDALIAAGVGRVVVGVIDPNPLVAGRGVALLEDAGIEVTLGVLEAACRRVNAPFFKYIHTQTPYVTAKYAMTLDGKIATRAGASQWISGAGSRRLAHRLRDLHDAVIVGKTTAMLDDPRLTVRDVPGGRDPIRIVLDPRGELPSGARVLDPTSQAPTWIICGPEAAEGLRVRLGDRAEVIPIALDANGHIPISSLLKTLGAREIMTLLAEGGGAFLASLFEADQIDEVVAFVAPKLIGGTDAPTPLGGVGVAAMADGARVRDVIVDRIDDDLVIRGRVARRDTQTKPPTPTNGDASR